MVLKVSFSAAIDVLFLAALTHTPAGEEVDQEHKNVLFKVVDKRFELREPVFDVCRVFMLSFNFPLLRVKLANHRALKRKV